jgi:GTP pyrophosphokinase
MSQPTTSTELFTLIFPDFDLKLTENRISTEDYKLATKACELAIEAQNHQSESLARSSEAAIILSKLNIDHNTLIATLLSDNHLEELYSSEHFEHNFPEYILKLAYGIRKLNQFKEFRQTQINDHEQNERLRQMILTMTTDIRIMIVKLAYRVARMRVLKHETESMQTLIASETQLIFAPLANRLGIAQLKWELEDLSFRFLEPSKYKQIASSLDSKRTEREEYIRHVIEILTEMLNKCSIKAKISGRPKHIFSIWKKISKKNVPIEELYDLRAVRIYVDSIKECYEVLGMIHSRWNYVKQEFDDYIASPKENGYQSIHTVIIGPENKTVEIQIRTHDMHHNAEYGVAAHWRYKEGGKGFDDNLERSISSVRQLLENSSDPDVFNEISTELQTQHIYVMTPAGEIVTLRQGSTPLDFAYNIHTELGHRCRGAKINGRIQPLTYKLKTGDRVEILTIKAGQPSRNWLNPSLGYLNSSSARHKVRSWFNKQNRNDNIQHGHTILHRELRRLHAESLQVAQLVERFHAESEDQFYEELGKGSINERQLVDAIQLLIRGSKPQLTLNIQEHRTHTEDEHFEAYVIGGEKISTHLATCCNPEPGNEIIGFVTRGRGVTIHNCDCSNILNLSHEDQRRLIPVTWDKQIAINPTLVAKLHVLAFDRKGLLRDIMSTLTELDVNLIQSKTQTIKEDGTVNMILTLEVDATLSFGEIMDQIETIQNVESVSMQTIE